MVSGLQQALTQWYQYVQPVCSYVFLIAMDTSLRLLASPPGHESRFDLCDMVRTWLALLSQLRLHRAQTGCPPDPLEQVHIILMLETPELNVHKPRWKIQLLRLYVSGMASVSLLKFKSPKAATKKCASSM